MEDFNKGKSKVISSLILASGLVCSSVIGGMSLYKAAYAVKNTRTIEAIGVAEKKVLSNFGTFNIACKVKADSKDASLQSLVDSLIQLLTESGVSRDLIIIKKDDYRTYGEEKTEFIQSTIKVSGSDVYLIQKAWQKVSAAIAGDGKYAYFYTAEPVFEYSGVESIKAELLKKAGENVFQTVDLMLAGTKHKRGKTLNIRQGSVSDYNNYETKNEIIKLAKLVVRANFELID